MRIFALAQDLALDTNKFYRQYLDAGDPQHLPLERLYLDVGEEVRLIVDKLKQDQRTTLPPSPTGSQGAGHCGPAPAPNLAPPGLRFIKEDTLLAWPRFPARLGRISSRLVGDGLYQHTEAAPLPAQLQALRIKQKGHPL